LYTLEKNNRQFTPYLLDLPLEYGALKENSIDRQGTAWLGTARDGVFAVNTKRKELVNYRDSLPYTHIYRPFEDSAGNVWMLNNSGHLVYDLRLDKIHVFDSNVDTKKTFLLGRNFCECPNGEVWLAGSDGGLGLLSQTTPEKGIIQKIIPTHPARAKISIQGIACNSKNELWAIDNDVIIKINRADWSYDFFQLDYGVKSWFGLFRLLKNDQLFIGAQDGFYLLDTKQLLVNERVPKPYVSKIITTESEQNQIEAYLKSKPISLSPSENVVTIEFSAINHTLPEKTKYLYQLEGIDKDWIDPKENRAFTYSYLPGGDYTFKIKAANNEGIWSEAYELPIHVGTPWYKTTLFWMALISLILTLAYLYYRNRIRRIQRDNQLKSDFERKVADLEMGALRAQMNPHFIFNCLNSIEAFVIRNDTRKASKYLNAFGKLVRLILQNSRQAYVNLQDELDSLKLYIELEQMRFQNRFQYELILKDGLVAENYKVPPMLLQPFVENSILHGLHPKRENGKIIITISEQNDALECVIEDNGIGRVAAAKIKASRKVKRKSMGMDITIERIETLNKIHNTSNQVFIKDLYDEERNALGTEVRVVIPF
ncbi:MAG: histidine kinase, partial [Bacteroidota bacterium]